MVQLHLNPQAAWLTEALSGVCSYEMSDVFHIVNCYEHFILLTFRYFLN